MDSRSKFSSDVISPIELGIIPVNWLNDRLSDTSEVRELMVEGNEPTSKFDFINTRFKDFNKPIVEGIVPNNLLELRSKDNSDDNSPIDDGMTPVRELRNKDKR